MSEPSWTGNAACISSDERNDRSLQSRVALLTNFVPPYRIPVFLSLARRVESLRIFISTRMEPNRPWPVDFSGLHVELQKSVSIGRNWRHPMGFTERVYTHFPYATVAELSRYGPSVTISSEFGFRSLNAALFRSMKSKTRLLIWATLSEASERNRGKRREILRHLILRVADGVIVNGHSGARYIASFGFPRNRIFIVPQTIDVKAFEKAPLARSSEASRRLLFVGQLVPRKGVRPFLEILAEWCRDHGGERVEFLIAGDGPAKTEIAAVPVPPNLTVKLLGNVAYSDLPGVYAQAGILAFPTLADEWGLVVNEGMAAGLPILGSIYSQAVEDLVEEGRHGWTFAIDQPSEVYSKIDAVFAASEEHLQNLREAAREKAMQLTPSVIADRICDAITQVAGLPGHAHARA